MPRFFLDLRFALRNLRRSPLFTLVAVASLALGIGANTAIFTLVDQLILRLLPVSEPEQLVMIWSTGPHMGNNRGSRAASYPMYQDFQQKAASLLVCLLPLLHRRSLSFSGQTERVAGRTRLRQLLPGAGVKPAIGRVFSPEEDDRVYKGHPSVVLGYDYWVTRFAGDPSVIGQKLAGQQLPDDNRGRLRAGLHRPGPARIPADPRPHPDEASDDSRLGRSSATAAASGSRCSPA